MCWRGCCRWFGSVGVKRAAALVLLALLPATSQVNAAVWTVAPATSSIGFTATWLGKPVNGVFKRWSAVIDFDPAKLAAAKVNVSIDLGSAVSGDKTVDGTLPEADWFAVKTSPTARFASTRIDKTATGYVAHGTLTIRGKVVPVDLPFTLAITGDIATMAGSAKLDRRSWGIGAESDATAEYVAFAVPVTIKLSARRKP